MCFSDVPKVLQGDLVERWIPAPKASSLVDAMRVELGLDLSQSCHPSLDARTPSEMALITSPEVLRHMIKIPGFQVNLRLQTSGGTLFHKGVALWPDQTTKADRFELCWESLSPLIHTSTLKGLGFLIDPPRVPHLNPHIEASNVELPRPKFCFTPRRTRLLETLRALLAAGAHPYCPNSRCFSPLHTALT